MRGLARAIRGSVLILLCVLACGTVTLAAPVVLQGSDYWRTTSGTVFNGIPFVGVPVGPGNTDTIVRRMADAVLSGLPSSAIIPIELVALNLVSAFPIDMGAGLGLHYITLQSARGGPASTGQMDIHYTAADDGLSGTPEGTFDSFFDVFFDIRLGALNGPIVMSDMLQLNNQGATWDATPPPGITLVSGPVGDLLASLHTSKGQDQLDFFPGPVSERHPGGIAIHNVENSTPEPESALLLAAGLAALICLRGRRAASR